MEISILFLLVLRRVGCRDVHALHPGRAGTSTGLERGWLLHVVYVRHSARVLTCLGLRPREPRATPVAESRVGRGGISTVDDQVGFKTIAAVLTYLFLIVGGETSKKLHIIKKAANLVWTFRNTPAQYFQMQRYEEKNAHKQNGDRTEYTLDNQSTERKKSPSHRDLNPGHLMQRRAYYLHDALFGFRRWFSK